MYSPSSGYRLILDDLRAGARGTAAGTRLPSEHELAQRYGVSRGTARRALDELMREGRAVRVQGKGTFVSPEASRGQRPAGGSSGASRAIVLLVGDVRRIEPRFLHAVEQTCTAAGYRLQLVSSGGDAEREIALLRSLGDDGCAGVLLRSYQYAGATAGLGALDAAGIPYVLVDRTVVGAGADSVVVDHEGGAFQITRRLLMQGHRRIALLLHRRTPPSTAIEARIAGYLRAHAEAAVPVDPWLVVHCGAPLVDDAAAPSAGDPIPASFRSVLDLLLAVAPAVTAWIGVNDVVAASALRHALDRNIAVPLDLSVAGFDGSAFTTVAAVPLSTVSQPFEALGAQATARLLRRIADPTLSPLTLTLPVSLLPGATTAPPLTAAAAAAHTSTTTTPGGPHAHQS
jgi:DNA-binding LacI/PurR family transcriptional regulator